MSEAGTINAALVSGENEMQDISREQKQRKATLAALSFHGNWVPAFHTEAHHKVFGKYAGAAPISGVTVNFTRNPVFGDLETLTLGFLP